MFSEFIRLGKDYNLNSFFIPGIFISIHPAVKDKIAFTATYTIAPITSGNCIIGSAIHSKNTDPNK